MMICSPVITIWKGENLGRRGGAHNGATGFARVQCLYLLVLLVLMLVGACTCWYLLYFLVLLVLIVLVWCFCCTYVLSFTHCILGNAQVHYFAKQEHYGNTMATLSFYAMLVMLTHHHHQFRRKLERFEVCSDAKRSWYGRS